MSLIVGRTIGQQQSYHPPTTLSDTPAKHGLRTRAMMSRLRKTRPFMYAQLPFRVTPKYRLIETVNLLVEVQLGGLLVNSYSSNT